MIAIDSNVIIRFVLQDDPKFSPKAQETLAYVESSKQKVLLSPMHIAEIVYVLLKVYKLNRIDISKKLLPIIMMNNVTTDNKIIFPLVFERFVAKNIDFEDAYLVTLMEKKRIGKLYSFDKTDFDKFPQIKRLEE